MKLIARIFAETGIKDLFWLLHATIRKNGGPDQFWVKHSGKPAVTVNPREWRDRDALSVNVGLGSGGKTEQLQQLMGVINLQKDAVAAGLTNLVGPSNLYKSAVEFAKLAGRKDYSDFFTDPATAPAPQQPPDPKLMAIQAQSELQQAKQQTDAAHEANKMQADMALEQQKFEHEKQMALLTHQVNVQGQNAELQHKANVAQLDHQVAIHRANLDAQIQAQAIAAKPVKEPKAAAAPAPAIQLPLDLGKHISDAVTKAVESSRPKKIKAPSGKVYEVIH